MKPGAQTGDPYGPWWDHNMVVFDVETTGLANSDRIVEVGVARFELGECVATWGSLVDPGIEIPADATAVHGIRTADVAAAPSFVGILPGIIPLAHNAWPVAYNVNFDKGMWFRELDRLPIDGLTIPLFDANFRWFDPLIWIRRVDGFWEKNSLSVACERRGIPLHNAHRATHDAVAAGKVLISLRDQLQPWTMTEMLRRQALLHQQQEEEQVNRYSFSVSSQ